MVSNMIDSNRALVGIAELGLSQGFHSGSPRFPVAWVIATEDDVARGHDLDMMRTRSH
jgi:hypothetical protein